MVFLCFCCMWCTLFGVGFCLLVCWLFIVCFWFVLDFGLFGLGVRLCLFTSLVAWCLVVGFMLASLLLLRWLDDLRCYCCLYVGDLFVVGLNFVVLSLRLLVFVILIVWCWLLFMIMYIAGVV